MGVKSGDSLVHVTQALFFCSHRLELKSQTTHPTQERHKHSACLQLEKQRHDDKTRRRHASKDVFGRRHFRRQRHRCHQRGNRDKGRLRHRLCRLGSHRRRRGVHHRHTALVQQIHLGRLTSDIHAGDDVVYRLPCQPHIPHRSVTQLNRHLVSERKPPTQGVDTEDHRIWQQDQAGPPAQPGECSSYLANARVVNEEPK